MSNSIASVLTRWSREIGDFGGAKDGLGGSGPQGRKVLQMPLGVQLMQPMMAGTERGRCFLMMLLVSSGQVAKKPLSMALQKVDFVGNLAVAWRNVAKACREGW